MKIETPYNRHVPKDVKENLRWRARAHHRVMEDPGYACTIREACKRDPLFFINGFGYTYAPKDDRPFPKLPFILYPFQEDAILEIIRSFAVKDKLIIKTRDMGASWVCVTAVLWAWYAKNDLSFLLGSRVQEYVDQSGNPKSMFWKFDYFVDNLPSWLKPDGYDKNHHRRSMHVENPENGSVIDGESTNKNFARGDRRTAIILDEFAAVENGDAILASTAAATNCRIFNSTPQGINNSFYDKHESQCEKIVMHWTIHPEKSVGLYTTDENGGLKILDHSGYPDDYHPILDGKTRSPFYDNECARESAQIIAQELDMDFLGSGHQFFNADIVRAYIREFARQPISVGYLEYDALTGEPIRFREDQDGNLKLWFFLDKDGNPPLNVRYTLGTDVSAGTGASNSALSGWNNSLLEQVLEYANPYIRPEDFARQAAAIGWWLGKAFIIWESGGPGRQFGSRLLELRYPRYYLRRRDEAISKKVTEIPGVAVTSEAKLSILSNYRSAIDSKSGINRSKESLEEALEYVYGSGNRVYHARSKSKTDPTGADLNHGDRCMAAALAWKGINERTIAIKEPEKPIAMPGSLAWRIAQRKLDKIGDAHGRELPSSWN